jgi:hypothetical protein
MELRFCIQLGWRSRCQADVWAETPLQDEISVNPPCIKAHGFLFSFHPQSQLQLHKNTRHHQPYIQAQVKMRVSSLFVVFGAAAAMAQTTTTSTSKATASVSLLLTKDLYQRSNPPFNSVLIQETDIIFPCNCTVLYHQGL